MNGQDNNSDVLYRCIGRVTSDKKAVATGCAHTALQRKVDARVLEQVGTVLDAFLASDPAARTVLRAAWQQLRKPDATADGARRIGQLESAFKTAKAQMDAATLNVVKDVITK
jgi:hypothetical protein